MEKVKVEITSDCQVNNKPRKSGDIVEVTESQAEFLIARNAAKTISQSQANRLAKQKPEN